MFLLPCSIKILYDLGVQLLAQWLAPLVLTTWAEVRIPPIAFWGGDLMEGNPRDPSHLPHYCPDVPHTMSNSGLSGSGQ